MGMGLGYVDVPLLASALLSETPVWIEDKKLKEAARKLNASYNRTYFNQEEVRRIKMLKLFLFLCRVLTPLIQMKMSIPIFPETLRPLMHSGQKKINKGG